MQQSFSDSETEKKTPPNYVQMRYNKRHRSDDFLEELKDFKADIKQMISSWMSSNEEERVRLQRDIKDIKSKIQEVKNSNSEIEKSVEHLSHQFDGIMSKISSLEIKCSENQAFIQQLEQNIESLQRSSLKATIEFRNIPAKKGKESTSDLISIVTRIGTALNLEINPSDVRDIYRLPNKSGSSGIIVAEFTSVLLKNDVLQAARSFNSKRSIDEKLNSTHIGIEGKKQPIFVSEHLNLTTRKIFAQARQFAKDNHYKYCWSTNARIFLRKDDSSKQILIKTEKCLNDLIN
ncbi:unnamed protein product [Parnassius apollo]|uniref:(apollo) hypothetical protein n=1 Tax=Parnassius apollo TaxID=110799 RepID=A0A8S3X2A3_PARAO|nr:unnamed protein product [Parnassius apollo]